MKKDIIISLIILFFVIGVVAVFIFQNKDLLEKILVKLGNQPASISEVILNEAGGITESSSDFWWLNSGGLFYLKDGSIKTIQGELSKYSKWRLMYFLSNPTDTDNGYHPQNIFRLVTRNKWQNLQQEAYFKIIKNNLSDSPNRNASNGLLLFNRYQDANNLYYTGIRVDGTSIIKKKIGGTYYTMDERPVFTGGYNRDNNPNLLPKDAWIGLRSEVKNNTDGTVSIKLFVDNGKTGNWVLIAEAIDDGKNYGGLPILNSGYGGIRTDFMDVEFDNYKISELGN